MFRVTLLYYYFIFLAHIFPKGEGFLFGYFTALEPGEFCFLQ